MNAICMAQNAMAIPLFSAIATRAPATAMQT